MRLTKLVAFGTCAAAKGCLGICNQPLPPRGCLGLGGDLICRVWAAFNLLLLIFQQRHQTPWSNTSLFNQDKKCLLLISFPNSSAVMRLVVVKQTPPPPGKKARRSSWVLGSCSGGWTCLNLLSGLGDRGFLQTLNCTRKTGKQTGERVEAEAEFCHWVVGLAGGPEGSRDPPAVLRRLGHSVFMFLWVCWKKD